MFSTFSRNIKAQEVSRTVCKEMDKQKAERLEAIK